jgi:Clp amino terminal domain, pathogenicity island component
MFERYTEGARRTIFFARYEARQFGSTHIDTEHLLLGLLREDKALFHRLLPDLTYDRALKDIVAQVKPGNPSPTNVDLPLSNASTRALAYGAEEAERLTHRHIGTEHLLLGLLCEQHLAAEVLQHGGGDIAKLRAEIAKLPTPWFSGKGYRIPQSGLRRTNAGIVEIHGSRWRVDYIHDAVKQYRAYNWHWHKSSWRPRDVAVTVKDGTVSFDLALAKSPSEFLLVKDGWKIDRCIICRWELFESKDHPEHSTGYTNGRDWLCEECHEKFFSGKDFFSSPYPDLT